MRRCRAAGERLVALRADLPFTRQRLPRRSDPECGKPLQNLSAAVEHAEVRREDLVGRHNQQISSKRGDVDPQVRCGVHRVDVGPRAGGVGDLDNATDVGDRPERVRGHPDGHDPGPVTDDLIEGVKVERRPVLGQLDPAHGGPPLLGDGEPWRDVGVVIHARDDDLVAGPELAAKGAAHGEGQRRHVRAERDLVGIVRPEEVGAGRVDLGQHRIGLDRGGEGAAMVGIPRLEVRAHRVDALARHLRPARSVQVGHRTAVDGAPQRREVVAQGRDVETGPLAD